MSTTLTLVGDVISAHGFTVLAATDDLAPTNAADPNLNLTLWSSIAGVITPFIVALINQPQWSALVRALMTVAASIGLGAATAAVEGQLTGVRWTTAALVIGGAAVASYKLLWQTPARQLELASSGRHAAPDA